MVLDDIMKSTLMSELCKFLIYEGFMQHQTSRRIKIQAKLYIPSTTNITLILWHTQLIVCAVKC